MFSTDLLLSRPHLLLPSSTVENPISSAVEKPLSRQVSKFTDEYGLVSPYCCIFEFEINPDYDYRVDCDTDDEEDTNHVANPLDTLIKYVAQIRKSFGFDVDCIAPSWFNGTFVPFDMEEAKLEYPEYYQEVLNTIDFAVAEINSDSVTAGKSYELVNIEKVVRVLPWKKFLTLRVKEVDGDGDTKIIQAIVFAKLDDSLELIQWRFKPAVEDVWFQPHWVVEK